MWDNRWSKINYVLDEHGESLANVNVKMGRRGMEEPKCKKTT